MQKGVDRQTRIEQRDVLGQKTSEKGGVTVRTSDYVKGHRPNVAIHDV